MSEKQLSPSGMVVIEHATFAEFEEAMLADAEQLANGLDDDGPAFQLVDQPLTYRERLLTIGGALAALTAEVADLRAKLAERDAVPVAPIGHSPVVHAGRWTRAARLEEIGWHLGELRRMES